jgi:V8-like Glu-specific endopeptidase
MFESIGLLKRNHRYRYLLGCVLLTPLVVQAQKPVAGSSEPQAREAAAAIGAYWTPERMASAVPMDESADASTMVSAPTTTPSVVGPPESSPGKPPRFGPASTAINAAINSASAAGASIPGPASLTVYPYPFSRYQVPNLLYDNANSHFVYPWTTVGKLFFTDPTTGGNFVCSASVIRPHLLLTARHCVFNYRDPSGGYFYTNEMFYPGYSSTNPGSNLGLGGGWPARLLYTWVSGAPNYRYDIGFIQTYDDDGIGCGGSNFGSPIEAYTGFLGWAYDFDPSSQHWDELGYPQAAPFNGQDMQVSESSTGAVNPLGGQPDTVEVGNDLTGGSSGGPWLLFFGYANGLNSFKWTNPAHPNAMNGPVFYGYNFGNLLTGAQGLTCP